MSVTQVDIEPVLVALADTERQHVAVTLAVIGMLAVKLVADKAVGDEIVVGGTDKLVGARLDRQIDEAAGETGRRNVVIGGHERRRLNGIEVDRRTRRRVYLADSR